MTERKPIVCLDFDGVINSYASGWRGATVIPDPIVPGTVDWLVRAERAGLDLQVFSSRSHVEGGIEAMQQYLWRQFSQGHPAGINPEEFVMRSIRWPRNKPAAFMSIDDRAARFEGDWTPFEPHHIVKSTTWWERAYRGRG